MSFLFFLFYFFLFLFGLCIGSFLNAVIFRLEKGESVIAEPRGKTRGTTRKFSRSYCPHCRKTLKWHDLIPVLSFFILRGKCRYCGKNISWQYPLIEIATGLIFLLISNFEFLLFRRAELPGGLISNQFLIFNFKFIIDFVYWFYIASVLIVVFVYDFRHYIIPDKILFPAIVITLIYRFWEVFGYLVIQNSIKIQNSKFEILISFIAAAVIVSAFFLAIVLISKGRAMGLGDVKLAFLMGLILGWPNIFIALFLAFSCGAIVGLALVFWSLILSRETFSGCPENVSLGLKNAYTLKSQIPFAPFLIAGTFSALFWGEQIISWYSKLFF